MKVLLGLYRKKLLYCIASFSAISLLFASVSCSAESVSEKNILTVTIEPYRFIVEAIAGEAWEVNTLIPKGANPETYDPTPVDIVALAKSRTYFTVGGFAFENSLKGKISDLYPELDFVDTSVGVVRDAADPHLWTSPDNIRQIALNVYNALCELDSAGCEGYRSRLLMFNNDVLSTDSLVRSKLCDAKNESFLIFHPTLTYFAKLYGLNQIAIEHEGKEPSVLQMRTIIDSARECGVKCVLLQAEFDRENAVVIADEIGADIYDIAPLSYNWHAEMLRVADVLSNN